MASRAAMDTLAENLAHPNSKEILKSHNLDSIQKLADIMPEEKLTRYSKIIGKMKKSQPIDIPKANSHKQIIDFNNIIAGSGIEDKHELLDNFLNKNIGNICNHPFTQNSKGEITKLCDHFKKRIY